MSRAERVAQRIKFEVSEIIRKYVDDPRIGFVTITGVSVSQDIKNAKILFSIMGDEENKKETMKGLNSAKSFIKGKLGETLNMRLMPQISFVRDDSLEKASHVWSVMSKLKK